MNEEASRKDVAHAIDNAINMIIAGRHDDAIQWLGVISDKLQIDEDWLMLQHLAARGIHPTIN